ncbi:Protein of unknown function [Algoriella xinjiangensis]|uniref:DUF3037 domain-containing protein n=1 Tax=Algoriella xinjiangensis TaxID=684065 RepID=A0A1I5A2M3_9FLAO|nr:MULTISPECIES: DUF3037 domain-containing protein [Algoriella]MBO6212084.1 DUF3037 domain-containing protein [Algoriella sp.]SFN56754.1 Protein of unknown function [Algoriella xinjiangensis]VDH16411.1 Protein of uncharacterised function (DUF3037) [Algoriella xinjiangensis]
MPEKILYEYAILRLVPKVEREEFINIGVILFSKKENYLKVKYFINDRRINAFCHELDLDFIDSNLNALSKIAEGLHTESAISEFDVAERFRWLTAVRSSVIQSSRPHPGKTNNLEKTLDKLFKDHVL